MRTISAFGGEDISCYKVCVASTMVQVLERGNVGQIKVDQENTHGPGMILISIWLRKAHLRDRKRQKEAQRVRLPGVETGVAVLYAMSGGFSSKLSHRDPTRTVSNFLRRPMIDRLQDGDDPRK